MKIISGLCIFLLVIVVYVWSGIKTFIVETGSMAPAIPVGSLILVYPNGQYVPGDIITYRHHGTNVTHRVVLERGVYMTKGDRNTAPDAYYVRTSDIIGAVVLTIPWTGFLIGGLHTWYGFVIGVCVPAVMVLIGEVRAVMRELSVHEK